MDEEKFWQNVLVMRYFPVLPLTNNIATARNNERSMDFAEICEVVSSESNARILSIQPSYDFWPEKKRTKRLRVTNSRKSGSDRFELPTTGGLNELVRTTADRGLPIEIIDDVTERTWRKLVLVIILQIYAIQSWKLF